MIHTALADHTTPANATVVKLFSHLWDRRLDQPEAKALTTVSVAIEELRKFTGLTKEQLASRLLLPVHKLVYLERNGKPVNDALFERFKIICHDHGADTLETFFEEQAWRARAKRDRVFRPGRAF